MTGLASKIFMPAYLPASSVKTPAPSTGLRTSSLYFMPDLVVLGAVARRGVDEAGAGLQGDVLAEDDRRLPPHERVVVGEPLERLPREVAEEALRVGEGPVGGELPRRAVGQEAAPAGPWPPPPRASPSW